MKVETPPAKVTLLHLFASLGLEDEWQPKDGELCEVIGRIGSELAGPRSSWPSWVEKLTTHAVRNTNTLACMELCRACIDTEIERLKARG